MENSKFKAKMNRLFFIDRKIRSGRFPNARTLAEEYEGVSSRTIKRDIEWLRDFQKAPIQYDHDKKGYYYTEENFILPSLQISEKELFSIAIAEQVLKQYQNTPIYNSLKEIFRKIVNLLPEKASIESHYLHSRFSLIQGPSIQIDPGVWKEVMRGLEENRTIQFDYTVPGYTDSVVRTLQPYHAVSYKSQWYIIGYEEYKESIRLFAMSRMENVSVFNDYFTIPASFKLEDHIDPHFGIFTDRETYTVKLRIEPEISKYFTERIWHPEQSLEKQPDGSLLLSFPTNQLEEIMFMVFPWGTGITIKEPPQLVTMFKENLLEALGRYKEEKD